MTVLATAKPVHSSSSRPHETCCATVLDEVTHRTVQAVAAQLGWTRFSVHEGGVETAVGLIADEPSIDLLIVDISDSEDPLAAMASVAEVCRAETKVVALGVINDIGLYRRLTEIGVSDYLVKPVSPEALLGALCKATLRDLEDEPKATAARRVAMIGSRGGVGVTTLAVSAAFAVSQNRTAVLLDLDLHFGNVGLSLDLTEGRGLLELLGNPERLDSLLVASATLNASRGLKVIGAEEPLDRVLSLAPAGLEALFTELRPSADCIFIDTPRTLDGATREVLEIADVVAIVTDLSLAGMRDTDRLLRLVSGMGREGRAVAIGNRLGGVPGELAQSDFERGIGTKLSAAIPVDMKAAIAAAQLGKAFGAVAKTPKTIAGLQALALALGVAATPGTPAARSSFLRRVRGK